MEAFSSEIAGIVHILRLDPGDDLLDCLAAYIKKAGITDGTVVSGIGTLDRCVLHMVTTTSYPPVEHFEKWEDKPLELASVQGFIADGQPHLHAVVSDSENAYAGHLESGCRVLYLAEIVILESNGLGLVRRKDGKGINRLGKK